MPQPVQPAVTIDAQMRRIAAFRPGKWNGRNFDRAFVKQLYDNYLKFSTPDKSGRVWYTPYVSVNHDDAFRFGRVPKAELGRDGTFYLWADRLPVPVAQWVNAHMLDERSVEFVEPKTVNGVKTGFVGPDGKVVDGPVLKCLSLLGNDVPGVKGLPPLPVATFRDRFASCHVSQFSARGFSAMNQDLVNQLQQLGFPVDQLPPDTSDAVLTAILAFIQGMNANNPANVPAGTDTTAATNPVTGMAGAGGVGGVVGGGTVASGGATQAATATAANPLAGILPANSPEQIVMKFHDTMVRTMQTMLAPIHQQMATIRAQTASATATTNRINQAARDQILSRFRDEMSRSFQVTPAMWPAVERQLKKCDYVAVRKFSDGKESGTELEEAMREIRDGYPRQKGTGGNPTPVVKPAPSPANANGGGSGSGPVSPERVRQLLGHTVEGKAALKMLKN